MCLCVSRWVAEVVYGVAITKQVEVPMTPYQSAVYKWVKVGKSRRCGVKQTLAWLLAGKCWGT